MKNNFLSPFKWQKSKTLMSVFDTVCEYFTFEFLLENSSIGLTSFDYAPNKFFAHIYTILYSTSTSFQWLLSWWQIFSSNTENLRAVFGAKTENFFKTKIFLEKLKFLVLNLETCHFQGKKGIQAYRKFSGSREKFKHWTQNFAKIQRY